MLLQVVAILFILICYCWYRYSPYFNFPCHFWIAFKFVQWAFLTRESERVPFGRRTFEIILSACKKYAKEGVCVLWLPTPILLAYSEESVKFFTNEETLIRKPYYYNFFLPEKYGNLLVSGGEKWRKERKLIAPAFKINVLRGIVPAMNRHAAALVQDLSRFRNEIIDNSAELFKTHSIRLFYETSMGFKPALEDNERARRLMVIAERFMELTSLRIARIWLHFEFIWKMSPLSKQYGKCIEDLTRLIMEIVPQLEERTILRTGSKSGSEEDPESKDRNYMTFGEVLMEQHLKDPSSFTKDDLIGQLFIVTIASFDTSSNSFMWTSWLLGLHPDVQEKAYEEITSETDGFLTFDDTRKLSYLECIIKESLRLYAVIPAFGRMSNQDIHFKKNRIPKNTPVVLVPYFLHRNPDTYPDPESFNPDRFRTSTPSKSPWSYTPFAEGVRSCIGKNYAMLQMKIFLAHVIKNFKIVSVDRREDVLELWGISLKPVTPPRLKFIPR